jgi:hypothetical protein
LKPLESLEQSLRQIFERLGAKIDSLLNSGSESSSVRSSLGNLSPTLQRAIDNNLRKDERGVNCLAPNRIRVLFDYETFSKFSKPSLRALEQELTTSARQYINDRRYKLTDPFNLTLSYDPLATYPIIRADFGDTQTAQLPAPAEKGLSGSTYKLSSISGPIALSVELKELRQGSPVTIGRGSDNTVVLDDESVSKFHATLSIDSEGDLVLADCGSTNGTFLNERSVEARNRITPGDILGFGDIRVRLERVE